MRRMAFLTIVCSGMLTACVGDAFTLADVHNDAGDTLAIDGGTHDAANTPDGGTSDAGDTLDTSANMHDAGATLDVNAPDAIDPSDTGEHDAGTYDASSHDASDASDGAVCCVSQGETWTCADHPFVCGTFNGYVSCDVGPCVAPNGCHDSNSPYGTLAPCP
jgi:hypothetical protein